MTSSTPIPAEQEQGRAPAAEAPPRWWWGFAFACVAGGLLLSVLRIIHFGDLDDAYITFTYARNIAEGRGFIYSADYATWGTTTPLFTLLLAAAGWLGASIPHAARALDLLALCIQMGATAWMIRLAGAPRWAPLGALLVPVPVGYMTTFPDMEYGLYAACGILALVAAAGDRWRVAAAAAATAALLRPDGALVWTLTGIAWLVHTRGRRDTAAVLAIAITPVLAWYTFAWIQFGALVPQTLGTRQVEAKVWGTFGAFWPGHLLDPRVPPGALLLPLAAGVVLGALNNRRLAWLGVYVALYLAMYSVFGLPGVHYYLDTVHLAGVGLVVIAAVEGGRRLHGWLARAGHEAWLPVGAVAPALLAAGCLWWEVLNAPRDLWTAFVNPPALESRLDAYRAISAWMDDEFPPGTAFATNEIGVLGYFSAQPLREIGGLVNPEGAEALASGDVPGLIERMQAPLLVAPRDWLVNVWPGEWTGAPPGHVEVAVVAKDGDKIPIGVYLREGSPHLARGEELRAALDEALATTPPVAPFAKVRGFRQ